MKLTQTPLLVLMLLNVVLAQADQTAIEAATQDLLDSGAAGATMALFDEKGISWSYSRGFADIGRATPITTETVLNVASISKTVTASSLMLLQEQGKLDLDRDINQHLPFKVHHPGHRSAVITSRQLLTHSSSIVDRDEIYFSDVSYHSGADNPLSLGRFLRSYLSAGSEYYEPENFADYPPGSVRQYSNIGFGLAGYLVEILSGQALNVFSANTIFKPLGMEDSGWLMTEIDPDQHATLYQWDGKTREVVDNYGLVTWPDGGMRTSVRDLARFFTAMMNGGQLGSVRIIRAETHRLMFTPQFSPGQVLEAVAENEGEKQALAWHYHTRKNGQLIVGHSGGDPGVTTHAYFDPVKHKGVILLINTSSEDEDFNNAMSSLLRLLLDSTLKS